MPIYEYVCEKCGKLNDVLQKINDPPPKQCNGCGAKGPMTKIVSRSSFVLRGGGWYSDLYSSTKKESTSGAETGKDAAPKATEPAPSTPGPKADSSSPKSTGATTSKKD